MQSSLLTFTGKSDSLYINRNSTTDHSHRDEVQFKEEAEKHIAKHATKNREEWKREILG